MPSKDEDFNLSKKIEDMIGDSHPSSLWLKVKDVKEFIKRRLERIDLIIKLYPHKSGEELAGQLKEDLMNDAGEKLK